MLPEPHIALAMIVRDEEEGLARCLRSAVHGVDEVIVVDTGSTDATMMIAAEFTSLLFEFRWCDDFSAARQYAFDQAQDGWIFLLDGDDEVAGIEHLRSLCAGAADDVGALCCKVVSARDGGGNVTQEYYQVRCVRTGWYKWEGAVHETLSALRPNRQVQVREVVIEHHGKSKRSENPLERNVRLLEGELKRQRVHDSRTLFYLARDKMLLGVDEEAIHTFKRYVEVATWPEEEYMARLYLSRLYLKRTQYPKAWETALSAIGVCPGWPDAYFLLAEISYYRKEWQRCADASEMGNKLAVPKRILFVDPLDYSYRWIIFYTNALYNLGWIGQALDWTNRALLVMPNDPQHVHNLQFFAQVLHS